MTETEFSVYILECKVWYAQFNQLSSNAVLLAVN